MRFLLRLQWPIGAGAHSRFKLKIVIGSIVSLFLFGPMQGIFP